MAPEAILEINDLKTQFQTDDGTVTAVDGVSFSLSSGEVLGVVGESGCGKSALALSILRLLPRGIGKVAEGSIRFKGKDLLVLSERELLHIRGNHIAMIFQDPMTSLNPVFTIGNQIMEALRLHQGLEKKAALNKSIDLLNQVSISEPEKRVHEYPHQLSGGMRQRVMIAMALSCKPELLIADEPTTALDVTIQAQILKLIRRLRRKYGSAVIFITHDLGVIAENADNIIVMYAGQIVEKTDVYTLFQNPLHPYTQGLLLSIPTIDERSLKTRQPLETIRGIVPTLISLPRGCRFQDRCNHAFDKCVRHIPPLREVEGEHFVACHIYDSSKIENRQETNGSS
jgi:peptide/nickel transport system ATP-binding protein/oligopeptide transport system ATP-binding protein